MLCLCWGYQLSKRGVELQFATRIAGFWTSLSKDEVAELIKLDERYATSEYDWNPNIPYSAGKIVRMNHEVLDEKDP